MSNDSTGKKRKKKKKKKEEREINVEKNSDDNISKVVNVAIETGMKKK